MRWRRKGRDEMPAFMSNHQLVRCQMPDCNEKFEGDDPREVWLQVSAHVKEHNEREN